jgi:hypothetical protein
MREPPPTPFSAERRAAILFRQPASFRHCLIRRRQRRYALFAPLILRYRSPLISRHFQPFIFASLPMSFCHYYFLRRRHFIFFTLSPADAAGF